MFDGLDNDTSQLLPSRTAEEGSEAGALESDGAVTWVQQKHQLLISDLASRPG
jgi:hypothetical protein